jgi:hypothetical protein
LIGSDGLAQLASKLRSAIGIDENSLAGVLSAHLVSRLDELNEQLDFICEYFGPKSTHSDELKRIQFSKEADRVAGLSKNEIEQQFAVYAPKYTIKDLAEWRHRAELLRKRNWRRKNETASRILQDRTGTRTVGGRSQRSGIFCGPGD